PSSRFQLRRGGRGDRRRECGERVALGLSDHLRLSGPRRSGREDRRAAAGGQAMNYETLRLSSENGIAILELSRPPVNALGRRLVEDLGAALAELETDASLRGLIVAAEGKAFCAGADLKERQTMTEDDVRAWVPMLGSAFTRLASFPA